jgi:hypothetical protein
MDWGIWISIGVTVFTCGMALLPIHAERKKGMALSEKGYTSQTNPRAILVAGSSLASYLVTGMAHATSVSSFRHRENRWHSRGCLLFCWRSIGGAFPCPGEERGCPETDIEEGRHCQGLEVGRLVTGGTRRCFS